MEIFIKNGLIWNGTELETGNVLVTDGVVNAVGAGVTCPDDCQVIDASGCAVLPGLVDVHVHLREPGYSYKETIADGTRAAAHGGFTTVCPMPNLNPAPDSPDNLRRQLSIIERDACIEVRPYATITRLRMGDELVDYEALAPEVAGFSDDGSGVQNDDVMRRAMEGIAKTGKILAAHCEVNSLLKGGYIHDGEYAREHGHRGICSESEWREVERDINLARVTGCRLHICHVSTAESVDLVRKAKAEGLPVTCETGAHYLAFTDADLQEDGRFKMNPPLRSVSDREAMGVTGIELSLPAVYTYAVLPGHISFARMIELMADAPRRIFGLEGGLRPGDRADMTVVDFNSRFTVCPERFLSRGKSTPFEGLELAGVVKATVAAGKIVYEENAEK